MVYIKKVKDYFIGVIEVHEYETTSNAVSQIYKTQKELEEASKDGIMAILVLTEYTPIDHLWAYDGELKFGIDNEDGFRTYTGG